MPKKRQRRKPRPVDPDALRDLRRSLGTKELARRMGIPAPSLRRLLGSGKGAGFPKQRPRWVVQDDGSKKLVQGKAFVDLVQRVGLARASEKTRSQHEAWDRVEQAIKGGYLDQVFNQIADELGLKPREVYTLGVSPK